MTVIEKIKDMKTTKGAPYYLVTANGDTYSAFNRVKAFEQLATLEFKVGDNVKLNWEPSGKYKNLNSIEVSSELESKPVPQPGFKPANQVVDRDSYWQSKFEFDKRVSKRITRMNCLTTAANLAIANANMVIDSNRNVEVKSVKALASELVAWVNEEVE